MPALLPILAALAPLLLLNLWPDSLAQMRPYLPALPWLVAVLGLLLSWRFNRGRPALALIALAAAGVASHPGLAEGLYAPEEIRSLLLFATLVLLLWMPERGLFSRSGLIRLAGFALVWVALFFAVSNQPDLVNQTLNWRPPFRPTDVLPIPAALILLWLLLILLAAFGLYRYPGPIEWALAYAALAGATGMYWTWHLDLLTWISLAALAPALALVELSHGLAFQDDLTGLPGRRALNEALERLAGRYCLAMVDIDHFKQFNDRHGHDVGDQVLKMVATRLAGVGCGGRAYRYGGEEFTLLFPGRSLAPVEQECERLRLEIAQAGFVLRRRYSRPRKKPNQPKPAAKQRRLSVTVSMGLTEKGRGESPEQVIKRADQALYRAKKAGRNRVVKS